MNILKVGLLQLAQGSDSNDNLVKGMEYCRLAKEMGADIALFPEMWNIGYCFPDSELGLVQWKERAIDESSTFIYSFKNLANELNMAIGLTYLEKWQGLPRNTISIIDRFGKSVLSYAKVHTCDFGSEANCTPGQDFYTCELDTEKGNIKVGAMICYDREFPESARMLMLKGAELILVPNACEMEENRKQQLRTRAYENMTAIALSNYAGGTCNGHSMAFDGIAFTNGGIDKDGVSRETLVIEAGEKEGVYLAAFDIDELRSYREREAWGNSYRKPKTYGLICSEGVEEPFVRANSRR